MTFIFFILVTVHLEKEASADDRVLFTVWSYHFLSHYIIYMCRKDHHDFYLGHSAPGEKADVDDIMFYGVVLLP